MRLGNRRDDAAAPPGPSSLTGLRVLVVVDNPDVQRLLQLTLQEFGADVTVAASSREALEILRDFKADVLVPHTGMPEEDGNVFIDRVRHLRPEEGGRTPAIAVTGFTSGAARARALWAGYQMLLPKPLDPEGLVKRIVRLVCQYPRISAGNVTPSPDEP